MLTSTGEFAVPHSGWREFARLPESVSWARLRRHLNAWPEAQFIDTVCNLLAEATLDFTFHEFRFRIDEKAGRYQLFIAEDEAGKEGGNEAAAEREAIEAVEAYCRKLLTRAG